MNKKFTYLVAALLASGGFSAMAADFTLNSKAVEIKDGAQIYLVTNDDGDENTFAGTEHAIGLSSDGTTLTPLVTAAPTNSNDSTFNTSGYDVTNYLWTVKEHKESGDTYYAFQNVKTGAYLAFDGNNLVTTAAKAIPEESDVYFSISTGGNYRTFTIKGGSNKLNVNYGSPSTIGLSGSATGMGAYKIASSNVTASELNSVLGGDGFSLAPANASDAVSDENNVFAQTIKAIEFAAITNSETGETIPAGMYFVVNAPEEIKGNSVKASDFLEEGKTWSTGTSPEEQDAIEAYIDAFKACTFIAVSPSESYNTTTVTENGLHLITISGAELNIYDQTDSNYATTGNQVYAGNAIFVVTEPDQYAKPGEYQLTVPNARIKDGAKDTHKAAALNIGVTKIQNVNYVTTTAQPSTFKASTSSLVKGIDLLNTSKTAAVYTIKFVSGEDEENSEYGKYLGSATLGNTTYSFVAQGEALVNTALPQYQFAITDVDTTAQVITFANIETKESFKTSLYATGVDNQYKLVGITENVNIAQEEPKDYTHYTSEAMSAMVVELTPVEVDPYAGFFQKGIDNNEPYRLVFAPNATTNNKVYVAVDDEDQSGTKTKISGTNSLQVVFEPVLKADNKTIAEEDISTNFAYNNNGKVYKASADLVSYYTYKMRVVDAEGAYLNWNMSANSVTIDRAATAADNAYEYIVKYRYDGSIALTRSASTLTFGNTSKALSAKLNASKTDYEYTTTYTYNVPDLDAVNLYLEPEQLGVSLAAEPAHYTFEAENGGFVDVNDANEGVIAIRTEAAEDLTFWVDTTASEKVIPSFYISKAGKFMYHSMDSLNTFNNTQTIAKENPYELIVNNASYAKAIFKAATLVNSDTLKTTVDNKEALVAEKADQNKDILGGLKNFQFQIVKASDAEDNYVVRVANTANYLANFNGELAFITNKDNAMRVIVERQAAPTANEAISATDVKVVALDGAVNVKNAAGKNVVISTILGQIVANEVLTSDNATISVPAGIAIVSVDGEEAVKVSVK